MDAVRCRVGYTASHNRANNCGEMEYALYSSDSTWCTNSVVSVSASKRLGSGVVASTRLRSVKLEREDSGVGLSVYLAANKP